MSRWQMRRAWMYSSARSVCHRYARMVDGEALRRLWCWRATERRLGQEVHHEVEVDLVLLPPLLLEVVAQLHDVLVVHHLIICSSRLWYRRSSSTFLIATASPSTLAAPSTHRGTVATTFSSGRGISAVPDGALLGAVINSFTCVDSKVAVEKPQMWEMEGAAQCSRQPTLRLRRAQFMVVGTHVIAHRRPINRGGAPTRAGDGNDTQRKLHPAALYELHFRRQKVQRCSSRPSPSTFSPALLALRIAGESRSTMDDDFGAAAVSTPALPARRPSWRPAAGSTTSAS